MEITQRNGGAIITTGSDIITTGSDILKTPNIMVFAVKVSGHFFMYYISLLLAFVDYYVLDLTNPSCVFWL